MRTEIDNELRKVELATVLCHLCSLGQLEKWVAETREQTKVNPGSPDL